MKSNRLTILAAISLGALVVLCCGYILSTGVVITHVSPPSPASPYRGAWISLVEGRANVGWSSELIQSNLPGMPKPGWHPYFESKLCAPSLRRSIWEFDAHSFPTPNGTGWFYILACPIWCVAIPFTIAPILWLRRRNASKEQRGFTVEPPADPVRSESSMSTAIQS